VPLEVLLGVGRFDPERARPTGHGDCDHAHDDHDHRSTFATWSFATEEPLSLEAVRHVVSRLPSGIYRAKGVIRSAEEPDRRAVLQVVGKRIDISLANDWGSLAAETQIVAIGAADQLDEEALTAAFDGCRLASASEART
jgi:G3E family GTPase